MSICFFKQTGSQLVILACWRLPHVCFENFSILASFSPPRAGKCQKGGRGMSYRCCTNLFDCKLSKNFFFFGGNVYKMSPLAGCKNSNCTKSCAKMFEFQSLPKSPLQISIEGHFIYIWGSRNVVGHLFVFSLKAY